MFQDWCYQYPRPCGEPLPTHASKGDPQIRAGRSGSVSCGVTVSSPRVFVNVRFGLCPPRVDSLSPPVLWKPYNHSQWPSRSGPWGFTVPLSDSQTGKPDMGLRTFKIMGKLLWYYCSPVTH